MTTTPGPVRTSPGRVVVGVDGSDAGGRALRWALAQSVRTGADVDAVACWQWPPTLGLAASYGDLDLSAVTAGVAATALEDAVALTPGAEAVVVRTSVVEGYPAQALVRAAEGADLLVVGSGGHSQLYGVLLGGTGLHCATHAPCPVVVVRGERE